MTTGQASAAADVRSGSGRGGGSSGALLRLCFVRIMMARAAKTEAPALECNWTSTFTSMAHTPCRKCAQKEFDIETLKSDIATSEAAHAAVEFQLQTALDRLETGTTDALHKAIGLCDDLGSRLRAACLMVSL